MWNFLIKINKRLVAVIPAILGGVLAPLLIMYGLNFGLSTVIGKLFFARGDAIALVHGTVMRNLPIALAIASMPSERRARMPR